MRYHRTLPPSRDQTNQIRSLIRAAEAYGCKVRLFTAQGRLPGAISVIVWWEGERAESALEGRPF
jgi:hypothetical protein